MPRNGGNDEELMLRGEVEDLARGGFVEADGIKAGLGDASELLCGIEFLGGWERSIGDGFDEKGFVIVSKKTTIESQGHEWSVAYLWGH